MKTLATYTAVALAVLAFTVLALRELERNSYPIPADWTLDATAGQFCNERGVSYDAVLCKEIN